MVKWLNEARAAGLSIDDIDAIYRSAERNMLVEGVA
jgi:hypothetical protein